MCFGPPEPKPQVPDLDPRIKTLADDQFNSSQNFAQNAGDLKQQQGNMAAQSSNQALADEQSKITKNANSRGLLYSGLRQGAMAGAQGAAAADLSSKRADINQGVDEQVAAMKGQALSSQTGIQSLKNQRQALAYNIAKQ